ncbi:MAG: argininosuccinate lyase [Sphaerochaetaceae bacterium]|jgi:argininosuccinate lyase
MSKLWQKQDTLDSMMQHYTVGNDYLLDQQLVIADVIGSVAHAKTLHKAHILSLEELKELEKALAHVVSLVEKDSFPITEEDEDCHTAIENSLVQHVGDVGKKIHTGRSRNDQVQTALRLWMRESCALMAKETALLAQKLFTFASKWEMTPMPGRTHMQLAMPSSVGLWASSFAEELLDETRHLLHVYTLLDQSPLGSAASYGTPLNLNRSYAAQLLGFSKVQNNVLYANNSRGKFEAIFLDACDYVTLTLSKLAQDVMLFSLDEIGYFSLPPFLCTGSSIMPQKRNPDGLELARSRSAVVSSCSQRIKAIIRSLPSGYNRDFQDTKEPLLVGVNAALLTVKIMGNMVEQLEVHTDKLLQGFRKEIYATDEVIKRLQEGGNFRDIYKEVGLDLESVGRYEPYVVVKSRLSEGTSGNLNLEGKMKEISTLLNQSENHIRVLEGVYNTLIKGVTTVV